MTLRYTLLGLVVLFGFSIWSACRPGGKAAHAQGADPVYTTEDAGSGGNHDEAARRYRANQSTHWRQVAIGTRGN